MRPTETTPLLASQKNPSITPTETRYQHSGSTEHEESRHLLQHYNSTGDEASSLNQDIVSKTASLSVPIVSEYTSETSPPGCRTVLFLVLLFSLFISNIEGSLLLTVHSQIASTFGQNSQSQWLIIAYPLACSAAEPVMGSLSNVVGRRPLLLISYVLFASAAMVCGAAPHFSIFIVGRVMAGIGGSGMIGMVNLIVSDLVGLKHLASYRSWFQAAMATGRLCGGPIGGFLTERLGWRLIFIAQAPFLLSAALSCAILIPTAPALSSGDDASDASPELKAATTTGLDRLWATLRSVDVFGAFLLVCTIILGLVSLNLLGDGYGLHDFQVLATFGLCLFCCGLLLGVEYYLVAKPMLSGRLLSTPVVVGVYLINILGMIAQASLTFILPLEERILKSATADRAGLQLLPLVAGAVIGSIAAGIFIKRGFNLTKIFTTAMLVTALARAVLYLCWYSAGPILRMLPLIVIGLSSSATFASTFIFLNAHISKADQAMGVACLFCLYGIGSAVGTTASKVIIDSVLRSRLVHRLPSQGVRSSEIIASLMGNHRLIDKLPEAAQATIQQSVGDSFSASRAFSLASQLAALPCLLLLRSVPYKMDSEAESKSTDEE